jgi:hypothetical protein
MIRTIRQIVLLVGLVVATAFALSCGDDTTKPTIDGCFSCPVPLQKKDLSNKSDVLNNIEYAYNKRTMPAYDELLDDNFTFFYTDSDIGGTPVQWGRPDEMTTTSGLLAAATNMDMAIDWRDSEGHSTVQWAERTEGSETWYDTTVFYHFAIRIGDTTYIPNAGSKAQFTVRNSGTAEKPVWKLVEFRDLGAPTLVSATSAATQPTTWGAVKAKYRP